MAAVKRSTELNFICSALDVINELRNNCNCDAILMFFSPSTMHLLNSQKDV